MSQFINDERTVLVRQQNNGDLNVALREDSDCIWGVPITLHRDESDPSAADAVSLDLCQARLVHEVLRLLDRDPGVAWVLRAASICAGMSAVKAQLVADQIVEATG